MSRNSMPLLRSLPSMKLNAVKKTLGLGTWMFLVRLGQATLWLMFVAANGWLMNYIDLGALGLGNNMIALEIMACVEFVYTFISMLLLHLCHKSQQRSYLITFIVWDFFIIISCIGLISTFAFAGVPNNCQGMTRSDWIFGDAPNNPAPGYQTIRFGPSGHGGMLDIYCYIPKSCYFVTCVALFTYTVSIILAMLRMYSYRYTSNIVVSKLCEEAEEKGKRAPSVSTRPTSRDDARLLRTPVRSSVSSSPISPVSSFHHTAQNEIASASVPDGSRGPGFRGGGADPPPYMPDLEAGMEGHASESNETRLSGYVKNQDFPGVN